MKFILQRQSCVIGIDEKSIMVVTGGEDDAAETKASIYGKDGWSEDLPDLQAPRKLHACGSFQNNHHQRVIFEHLIIMSI